MIQARTEAAKVNFQFSVEVKLNKPINNLHPECIQTAIERLITDNLHAFRGNSPEEILLNVWVSPKNKFMEQDFGRQPNSQLPIVTEKQRKEMSLALQELGDEDLEWTNDIISARKNKQYLHPFFDK
ncbi:MAG: hypothetical protein DRQ49_07940 [Gammaproteobacteria bacterium]|nr:MAG: hypothetical protein DRQ49_07940 [Gammaproteobacteria bacterium]RKZ44231.1 MAG: hypothetical protein DRQ41_03285 [Gammaproteobacteria bacterium]RKZ75237.1 MAG: hypothetical protein DRQ57_08275 [Gammaproteobacteria bacterium]